MMINNPDQVQILNKKIEGILKKECFYCGPVLIDMTDAALHSQVEQTDEWDYPIR
jgi:hypothetical protein